MLEKGEITAVASGPKVETTSISILYKFAAACNVIWSPLSANILPRALPQKAPKAYLQCRLDCSSGTSQFLPGQFLVIGVYRDGVTRSTMHWTDSFRHLVDCTGEKNPCQESLDPENDRRLLTVGTIFFEFVLFSADPCLCFLDGVF